MTPEEFDFWQRAYFIALDRLVACTMDGARIETVVNVAYNTADKALSHYRTAKATVVESD